MYLTRIPASTHSPVTSEGQPSGKRKPLAVAIGLPSALLLAAAMYGGPVAAAPSWCETPPCKGGPGGGGEPVGTNNLSYPVIWSDNVLKSDFTQSTDPWKFAEITDPMTQCVQQDPPISTVPDDVACYYGEKNLGFDEETGDRVFEPPVKTWWLQQRQVLGNEWQVFNITDADAEGGPSTTPVVVTGVDTGDLLESSITIKAKQIRTEFTLLKRVEADTQLGNATDWDYTAYLAYGGGTCVLADNSEFAPNNCMAAHNMSGAVPGTDQSINETQGTDFEFNDGRVANLVDPQGVKLVKNYFDPSIPVIEAEEPGDPRIVAVEPPVGMDATIYSECARLVIQRINDTSATPSWSSDASGGVASGTHGGYWTGGMGEPVVDVAAWDRGTDGPGGQYSAEINAGGSVIFGYNWNTKVLDQKGDYRVTFVLEGEVDDGGECTASLNTVFDGTTKSVNVGERRPATLLSADGMGGHHGEGGLVYVDVVVGASGGGGGGGKPKTSTPGGGGGSNGGNNPNSNKPQR